MIDSNQIAHFRERQAASLMDTCHRLVHSYTTNDTNEQIDSYAESNTDIPCGLEQLTGSEIRRDKDIIVSYDAKIRLLITQTFEVGDRVKITKRFGETLSTAIIYDIVSPAQRGPSGIRYLLKKVDL